MFFFLFSAFFLTSAIPSLVLVALIDARPDVGTGCIDTPASSLRLIAAICLALLTDSAMVEYVLSVELIVMEWCHTSCPGIYIYLFVIVLTFGTNHSRPSDRRQLFVTRFLIRP